MLQVIPGFTNIENFFKKYGIAFTLIVMYQGLFGGLSISRKPRVLQDLSENLVFKLFTLFCIAFTATKDIETSILSVLIFIFIINILRTDEEREGVSFRNII